MILESETEELTGLSYWKLYRIRKYRGKLGRKIMLDEADWSEVYVVNGCGGGRPIRTIIYSVEALGKILREKRFYLTNN